MKSNGNSSKQANSTNLNEPLSRPHRWPSFLFWPLSDVEKSVFLWCCINKIFNDFQLKLQPVNLASGDHEAVEPCLKGLPKGAHGRGDNDDDRGDNEHLLHSQNL